MMKLIQFHKYRAIFNPKRIDDLKEGSDALIGKELIFEASWTIEDDYCDGEYKEQIAMTMYPLSCDNVFMWCPSGDLNIVEDLGFMHYS